MLYRKQKMWIEFILRLLPFVLLFANIILIILTYRGTGNLPNTYEESFIYSISAFIESFFEDFIFKGSIGELFRTFMDWFSTNLFGNAVFSQFIFYMLFYQVFLSLVFLLFDFINFIIDFARKWVNGLYGKNW